MVGFGSPAKGVQLLRWNKKLPSASAQDPLGLNLRLSSRLATQLLFCITSITPRARYYAFFPWAFQDYADHEQGQPGDRGGVLGVLSREKAMVLGAVLHHDGEACAGGALGGSDDAADLIRGRARATFNLDGWKHLNAREGQFGAAYKASLINLGLFATGGGEVDEDAAESSNELGSEPQAIELTELSARGKRLAHAFQRAVRGTRYVKEKWTLQASAPAAVLKEFGARAGLCEILLKGAADREVIKEIIFSCDREGTQSLHYRRRMSLMLMLHGVGATARAEVNFDRQSFSDLTYYRRLVTDEERLKSVPVEIPAALSDAAERWRIFNFHGYLSVALQSLLVSILSVLRNRPGGIDRNYLLKEFSAPVLAAQFRKLFNIQLPGSLFDRTPAELLGLSGVNVVDALARRRGALRPIAISSKFSERHLARLLIDGEAEQASGIVLAAILMFALLLRYQTSVEQAYDAWYENLVQDRFADLSVPGVLGTLRSEYGDDWWHQPSRDVLNLLIWRFVLLQHQTMSYERGFGGSAPLFHIDGATIIGTDADFSDPQALNARFFSAMRILHDLKLVDGAFSDGFQLTSDGAAWLQSLLVLEAQR
jgi:hypothetical protein